CRCAGMGACTPSPARRSTQTRLPCGTSCTPQAAAREETMRKPSPVAGTASGPRCCSQALSQGTTPDALAPSSSDTTTQRPSLQGSTIATKNDLPRSSAACVTSTLVNTAEVYANAACPLPPTVSGTNLRTGGTVAAVATQPMSR